MCQLSWNLGSSSYWNPQGLSRPLMGELYSFNCQLTDESTNKLVSTRRDVLRTVLLVMTCSSFSISIFIVGAKAVYMLNKLRLRLTNILGWRYHKTNTYLPIWSDFDRASPLICGNKMPTRFNRWFLLQILLLAQHVSGTIMPIIRSSRVLYRWLLPVVFGALVLKLSVCCGAEGYVSGLRAAARKPNT
jgi:hypothetical protein